MSISNRARIFSPSISIKLRKLFMGMVCAATLPAFGQLQWSSYDANGNLITANVASGGDQASGTSVTFTIPANTQMSFATKSFTPFTLAGPNARRSVTFNMNASAGLSAVAQRVAGWGIYSSAGTTSLTDDVGYFGLWNGGGPYMETYDHPSGTPNLFSGTHLGQGNADSGLPVDGSTYTNQILLVMNAAATGISEGTSSSTLPAAGLAMNGFNGATPVSHRSYTNPVIPSLGGVTNFDEFVFMYNNTTANPVTVTLSSVSLVNSMNWDASGANPVVPTDGSGTWSVTNANWSTSGSSDNVWSSGYSAVFGANNGAAGVITNSSAVTVSNITFNAAGSGSYNIIGSALNLTGTPTITVASGVSATNSAPLTGTGFNKNGPGTFVLLPSTAAANVGVTTVNAGTLFLAGTGVANLNDDLTVNSGGVVLIAAGQSIPSANRFFINGGVVTNISASNPTLTYNVMAFDNGGILASAGAQIGQLNVTNFDLRSGLEAFAKFPSTMTTNFSVKSTPGTMIVQSRANSSGANGIAGLKINAGTFICDYANPAPNGDTTGGAKYISTAQMTLAGGTLFQRFNAVNNRTETVGGVLINPGATAVVLTNNSATAINYTFAQGAITRTVGGTVDYGNGGSSTGTKAITTTTAIANGILGGYATYAGGDWAVGTTIAPYAAYTTTTDPTTWVAANNVSLGAVSVGAFAGNTTINTLKYSATPVSDIALGGNTLTLAAGGLLVTGSAAPTISGGTLEGGSGADLIVQQYSTGNLTISANLADNTAATSLTKSGPGKLILTGTDTMTGTNFLNGGTVEVSDLSKLASGPLVMNNGTLHYTGTSVTSSRNITLNGVGGTVDVTGGTTVTQTGAVTGGGGFNSTLTPGLNLGDWGGLTKNGNGNLVLAVNNTYNGPTVVNGGMLIINGTNALTGASGLTNYSGGGSVTVNNGAVGGAGYISGAVDIKSGGIVSPGNGIGILSLGAGLTLESGATGFFEVTNGASGDLLAIQGNLVISNSTLAVNVLGTPLEPTTNVLITYTGTLSGSFNPVVSIAGGSIDGSVSLDYSVPGQVRLVLVPQVAITVQPADQIVSIGQAATFNVTATGMAPVSYQWYRYSDNLGSSPVAQTGATGASFTINNPQTSDSGFYGVVVSNNFNVVSSRIASLIVGNVAPVISGPTNATVIAGNNITFSTSVLLANPAPNFQWYTNNVAVNGATSSALTLTAVPFAESGMSVSVIATNIAGNATNTATLSVLLTPIISPQPTSLTVNVGDTAVFSAGIAGFPTPALQWYRNNVAISGQTASSLTIPNAQGSNIASYKLVASNTAGSVTSSVVTLTVNSTTLSSATLAPANGATGVCYDTPLYITFNGPISIINSGKIRIYNVTNSTTPVDTIDMSSNAVVISPTIGITNNIQAHSLFSGDTQVINYFPVIITGTTAAIYPHSGVMTSNQTYYVTMDNGIVADSTGAYFAGISATNLWQFTTKQGGPVNPTNLMVAADGTGDFATVQGAVDSLAPGNTAFTTINIKNGNYVEIVDITGKNNIDFRGQSRHGTVVGYGNNNNLTGTTAARMAFKVNSSDIKLENLTIVNTTPQGGSQAEALLIYNNGLRCVVDNCDIISRQDTILINASTSQGFFYNCRVVGNFDYIWGVGVGYFTKCVFHTITNSLSGSYNLTAARTLTSSSLSTTTPWINPNGTTYSAYGFSLVGCTVEADPGVTNIALADSNGTPGGLVSWVNCLIDTNAYVNPASAITNQYVFWQYSNLDITAVNPISFSSLITIGITNNDSRLLAATNIPVWFSGWQPQLAPNIVGQPTNVTVTAGQSASFSVNATGFPDPTYQWLLNGVPISGATGSSFTIASAVRANGGSYSVVVNNGSGTVTSSVAVLTYNNTAPVAPSFSIGALQGISETFAIIGGANPPTDADGDVLTVTGVSGTANGTVSTDGSNITYTAITGPTDSFTYTVSDGFGGTGTGTVSVSINSNVSGYNQISAVNGGNGTSVLTFLGVPGYNYALDLATNLVPPINWVPQVTNTAATSGYIMFTNLDGLPQGFYRTRSVH